MAMTNSMQAAVNTGRGGGKQRLSERLKRNLSRTYRIALILASLLMMVLVLNVFYKAFMNKGSVPVINAEGLPMWIKPADHGGVSARFKGFALNRIIGGETPQGELVTITLAPQHEGLPPEARSPREVRASLRAEVEVVPETDQPVTGILNQGEYAAGQVEDADTVDIESAISSHIDASMIATEEFKGVEVSPDSVPSGTFVAQLGNFSVRLQAVTRMIELRNSYPELLGDRDWIIEAFSIGNLRSFRLRLIGFSDFSATRKFCQNVSSRGVSCIPATVF